MKDGKKTKGTLRWLGQVSGGKKGGIAALTLLQAVLGAGDVWSALLLKRLIDGAVAQNRQAFFTMAVAFAVLLAIQILLRAVNRFLQEWTRSSLENQFKQRLFACLLRKDYAQVTAVHSGEWMNRLTTDTMEVTNGLCRIGPDLSGLVVKLVGALAALLLLIPELFWLLIPGSLVFLVLTACFRTILKDLHRRVREADGAVRIFLQERLNCLLIVRSFSREDQTLKPELFTV